ncbi:MAG: hypothetical protein QOD36_3862 [Mycobacterium sp.]|nr:hypothetical protein [Mycobacterium sp.]
MKKSIVLSAGSVVAASALMALFGTGVAAADDYAGQTYADASSAASNAGQTVVVAGKVGDWLALDACLVTRSQTAPFADADDGVHYDSQVQFYLNCSGEYATAKSPGASVASPSGREAKAAADKAAAEEKAALEAVNTPGQ